MIDFEDISKFRICAECSHVYLPETRDDFSDYSTGSYIVNPSFCTTCEVIEDED